LLLEILNPGGLINNSDYATLPFIVVTFVLFGIFKQYTSLPIKETLLVIGTIALSICGNTVTSNFIKDTSTYAIFLTYVAFYIVGYYYVLATVPLSQRINRLMEFVRARQVKVSKVLLAEIVVILLFFYIRTITKTYYGGNLLIHAPIPLDTPKSVTTNDDAKYHYSLSFWIYINATSPGHSNSSGDYTDIMVYGDNLLMAYNNTTNSIQIIMKNNDNKIVETIRHVKLQKWNHFVLSYANGVFDIFMNGDLVKSNTIVPKISTYEIVFGAENGVNGDVCNVLFFNKVLSKEKINSLYSTYKNNNPPIL
jgi:hypothetical protein